MPEPKTPRFKKGQRVLCKTGRIDWEAGTIVKLYWVDPWEGEVHPYQVRLHGDDRLIYVPFDDDDCCKKHDRAWWEDMMDREDLSDEQGTRMIRELSKGNDLDAKSHKDDTALLIAMQYDWNAGVEVLLELRADPNFAGRNSQRPLHLAVQLGEDSVRELLAARADPDLQDKDPNKDPDFESKTFGDREWHRTALHYVATAKKDVSSMRILLQSRADANIGDAQCCLPMHLAIEAQNLQGLQMLIEAKSDVNAGNQGIGMNSSLLIDAAYRSDLDVLDMLISAKADLNRQGKQGMTALHVAARGRHSGVVGKLVDAKADVNIKAAGKTAGELAAKNSQFEIASLLGHVIEQKENVATTMTSANLMDAKTRALLHLD